MNFGRIRSRARACAITLVALLGMAGACGQSQQPRGDGIRYTRVASGLESPVHLTSPPGDRRLFVTEQEGRIRIIANGKLVARPFLDITDRVLAGGERGLLSVAFHPDYAKNGFFYVNYTDRNGDTHVERYRVTSDPDRAEPGSAKLLLKIGQPYANHNGGHILFGPDGMLWVGMGDGGAGNDPHGNGQNPRTLLAKMLRIDVDHGDPYAIPSDNPFADGRAGRPEIWAMGVRNPWRFWIDPGPGMLYIADVGQNRWEEVDVAPAGRAGLNYGWNPMEGRHPLRGDPGDVSRFTPPAVEYPHSEGCSITGGVVYRGKRIPALEGLYLYSDYCRGWLRSFRWLNGVARDEKTWRVPDLAAVTSFGVDSDGEVYVLEQNGTVSRIDPER